MEEEEKEKIRKVAIYGRVSTSKQEDSLEEQIKSLEEYCKSNNYEIYDIYKEIRSGATADRPVFQHLLKDMEAKLFDAVVFYKLDRFSRSLHDLVVTTEKMKELGIHFISVGDKIDTSSVQGKMHFQMLGVLAEFEKELIKERTKIGRERAMREGKTCHRPPKQINWRKVRERIEQGVPLTEIAKGQEVSYPTLLRRMKEENLTVKKSLE